MRRAPRPCARERAGHRLPVAGHPPRRAVHRPPGSRPRRADQGREAWPVPVRAAGTPVASHPIGVHVGPGLTDDNELDDGGPLARAAEMDADGVQVFLDRSAELQEPEAAAGRRRAAARRRHGRRPRAVHAQRGVDEQPDPRPQPQAARPSTRRRPRRSARAAWWCTAATCWPRTTRPSASTTGARPSPTRPKDGGFPLPLLIENTAGGGNAMARDLDASPGSGRRSASSAPGSCSTPATPGRPAGTSPPRSTTCARSPAGSTSCT